jgi:hypothetical protein
MVKCKHGFYTDPNGYHIFPENTAIPITEAAKLHQHNNEPSKTYDVLEHETGTKYKVTEHDDGKTYTVTENKEQPKQEKSTDELIAEARKYIPRQEPKQEEPKQTKFDKQIEQSTKQWNEYYRNNPSKIRYNIFEEIEQAFDY